jgi:alpha-tubulin suppressor-like RCC1 family protein
LYSWGNGQYGELGVKNCQFSNVPLQIDIGDFFVDKVQCGKNFTALIDCNTI